MYLWLSLDAKSAELPKKVSELRPQLADAQASENQKFNLFLSFLVILKY